VESILRLRDCGSEVRHFEDKQSLQDQETGGFIGTGKLER
jgi:hypothetical protein